MKKVIILVGIAILIVILVVIGAKQATRKGTKVYEEEARKVDRLVSTVKASGEIQPRVYVNISSQVPGQIVELRVEEGDRVKKGDVLLQLDPQQYRSSVTRLEANLRLARINLDKEKTSLATYASTLRRQEALANQQVVSVDQLEQARLLVESSRIQVRGLEEQIQQAEADLVKARDELEKTTIRAPIDGLVTKLNAKLGEQVIIGTMNNPGTVILVLSDMSEMLAEVKVDETEIAPVRTQQKAVVTIDALEGRRFNGTVSEISHTAVKESSVSRFVVKVSLTGRSDRGAAGVTRELALPAQVNAGAEDLMALRPGMSAHAAVEVASKEGALVVPLQAVFSRKRKDVDDELKKSAQQGAGPAAAETGGDANAPAPASSTPAADRATADAGKEEIEDVDVIFVDRKGRAELVVVKTGLSDEFNVELIDAPIQSGDRIVVGPYRTLKKLKHGEALTKVEKDEELKEQK